MHLPSHQPLILKSMLLVVASTVVAEAAWADDVFVFPSQATLVSSIEQSALPEFFRKPLAANEKLMFVDLQQEGRESIMFLARVDALGMEPIATVAGLREHWQRVIRQRLEAELQSLAPTERSKVETAIDVTITRFIRDYELLCGLKDLGIDPSEYLPIAQRLSQVGIHGPWKFDPLIGQVMVHVRATE